MNAYDRTAYDRAAYGAAPPWDRLRTAGVPERRVLAWLVDAGVLFALGGVLWVGAVAVGVLTFGLGFSLLGLLPVLPFLYHLGFLAGPGSATPGQVLLGLRVYREADLGRPGMLQALVATLGLYLTLATGVIWLGAALLNRRRRTLHDLVSGLVVLRRGSLTPASRAWNMTPGPRDA